MKKKYFPLLAALAFLTPATLQAMTEDQEDIKAFEQMFPADEPDEADFYRQDRLLVSATGSLKPLRLAPSVASVVTKEDIEAIGATTLDEILQTVPGLYAAPSGFGAFRSIWTIRGVRTNVGPQVLLLINGVPMTDLKLNSHPPYLTMPVAMISRVEVVRGPGSAVHGADAFAGTINVITKDGHEVNGTQAGIRYGSFDTSDAWIQHGGMYGGWNIVAGIEGRKTLGDDDRIVNQDRLGSGPPSLTPEALDTKSEVVNINLGVNKDDQWIGHFYGYWQNNSGNGPGLLQALAGDDNAIDSRQLLADLSYHNNELLDDWDLSIKATYFFQKMNFDLQLLPASFVNMRAEPIHEGQASSLESTSIYDGFNNHRLRLAAGLKFYDLETDEYKNFGPVAPVQFGPMVRTKGTNDFFLESQNRWLWFLSAQDEWSIAKHWELTAGIRFDDYSDFGDTLNPRLALVWETSPTLTSKIMYGRAFRAPSFAEQHTQNNPVTVGNPDLDPEIIDTYELAFIWTPLPELRFAPSAFYYEIDGLIEVSGALPAPYQNARDQKGRGFEIEANWQVLDPLELACSVSYQRSEDKDTGEMVADTPEWQTYLTANWKFLPEWSLNGQYFWVAKRHRDKADPRNDIDDYDLVNLTLRRKNIMNHLDLAIAVRNVFDEDIREPSPYDASAPAGAYIPDDYPMETRAIWAELRYKF